MDRVLSLINLMELPSSLPLTPQSQFSPTKLRPISLTRPPSPSKLKLSHRSLHKLLSKAAHLESRLLRQPCNVAAYRKQWINEHKEAILLDKKHTFSLGSRKTEIHLRRQVISPKKEPLFPEFSPIIRIKRVPSRSLGLSVSKGFERKRSLDDLDRLMQVCDREQSLQRQLAATIKHDLRHIRPF